VTLLFLPEKGTFEGLGLRNSEIIKHRGNMVAGEVKWEKADGKEGLILLQ
jgi:hypothetical protein